MTELQLLQIICWALVGGTLCLFALTVGFDMGIGMLLPFIGRKDTERRVAINVIGPTWDGNQVWLIFGGGAIFACWPMVYATAFSGLYGALLLVLWSLFLRPLGFEYRNKIDKPAWRSAWDWSLFVGSFVPALVIGVGFGNLLQGLPFHFDANLRSVYTGNFFQLLNPFGIVAGLVSVVMFILHGSTFLQLRSEGIIQQRARSTAKIASLIFIALFATAGIWIATGIKGFHISSMNPNTLAQPFAMNVQHEVGAWLVNYKKHEWMAIAPFAGFIGAIFALTGSAIRKAWLAFFGSSLTVIGTVLTAGFSLFPFIMPSITNANESLTAWNATSTEYSLLSFAIAFAIFFPFVTLYTLFAYRKMWGKVSEKTVSENHHVLY